MAKTTVKDLSIKDRKKLLDEAIDFFLALGKEREDMDYLLFKAAALKGVKKSYEYIAKDVMEKELETDEDVKTATHILLWHMDFEELMKQEKISDSDAFRYYGWVGLGIGIMRWNDKLIEDFRKVQEAREEKEEPLGVKIDLSFLK